jgi:hypothetical protein
MGRACERRVKAKPLDPAPEGLKELLVNVRGPLSGRGESVSGVFRLDTSFGGGKARAIRITVDREFYEMHADSVEFWTQGSPTFPDLDVYRNE